MKTRERMKIYEDLVNLHAVSGFERQVRKYMRKELEKYADEIVQDRLGSIFGIKKGEGPVIMIAGHMDEVGAMVTGIQENGFIKMVPIGSVSPEVMVSQNVQIAISEEKAIRGIVGAIPPHMNRGSKEAKKLEFDDLLLDVGADSKEHAEAMGIRIGQQITFVNQYYFTEDGKKVVSKAWDNRFGCGMALEVLRALKEEGIAHPNTVVAGGTVQEEVGLRGATTASNMIKPDLFIAVDVSPVGDFLPQSHPRAFGKLGEGFLLRFYDPRNIMNPRLKAYFENLAQENGIKFQQFLSMGSTDAAAAQYAGAGALSATIGLPGRYIHSTAAMIHVDDVEAVREMLLAIVKDFGRERLAEIGDD
ncbi:MAG: M42 family metallopeptidase [Bacilli bacterium]|jgi:glutamyl aminopeptidase|nr:M42 family metallopeptidase [Acholeplasmataceae bacterium]